jgi:hypothetical protein
MIIASNFIAALQREQRIGNVSSETEQHLKHEFRKLGGADATTGVLAAAVDTEINRLTKQATTLQRLRESLLGPASGLDNGNEIGEPRSPLQRQL